MSDAKPRSAPSALRHVAYFVGVIAFGFVVDLVVLVIAAGA